MLEPTSGESIYDPTLGTGGMLISCLAEVKRRGGETRTMGLYGQELITITAAIARMNLVIHGVSDFQVSSGNTLAAPAFAKGDELRTFDVVLANPPYSIKKWNRGAWEKDVWGRNFLGTPPQGRADYAFFQHILKSMNPETGRCAILLNTADVSALRLPAPSLNEQRRMIKALSAAREATKAAQTRIEKLTVIRTRVLSGSFA
jgi:type I restriction enzyme M protein